MSVSGSSPAYDSDLFARWNSALSNLAYSVGKAQFAAQLESSIRTLVDFDYSMIFAYKDQARPAVVYHNVSSAKLPIVIEAYVRGPYALDPFLAEVRRGRREGVASLSELAPDEFFETEYYRRHYSKTKIVDEIGFFMGLDDGVTAVHSIARVGNRPLFSAAEYALLADAAPAANAIGVRHWNTDRALIDGLIAAEGEEAAKHVNPVDSALRAVGMGELTDRESEIVSLLLKGHSSESVALNLEISLTTVKTHRKNIYAKLKVSSQAELFSLFLDCLRSFLPEGPEYH